MARINLLPWREKLRKQRQRDFGFTILGALLLTVLGMGYWHFYAEGLIDHQLDRNRFLEKEIAKVNKQIEEIKNLEKTRQKLIARMKVIVPHLARSDRAQGTADRTGAIERARFDLYAQYRVQPLAQQPEAVDHRKQGPG